MATKNENDKLDKLSERVGKLEVRFDEVVIPKLDRVVEFVDENKSGITMASILNSKVVTVFIGGIVAAGLWFASKFGGNQ